MAELYAGRVTFFVVYIKEAHPEEDGCSLRTGSRKSPSPIQRLGRSASKSPRPARLRLEIRMPVLIDQIDNETARQYGGWPDRLYLIGRTGASPSRGRRARPVQARRARACDPGRAGVTVWLPP
jgi:hypothetical protein